MPSFALKYNILDVAID